MYVLSDSLCNIRVFIYFFVFVQFITDLSNVIQLRVILQQPSSVWKDFKIEELKLYRPSDVNYFFAL